MIRQLCKLVGNRSSVVWCQYAGYAIMYDVIVCL